MRRYRSVATDQGGHHQHRRQTRSSRNKGPIFRWIRSESGASTSRRSYLQDLSDNQSLDRPPVAFAYASTPAIGNQPHRQGRNSWKRKFSARKMSSSIVIGGSNNTNTTTTNNNVHYHHTKESSTMHF